MTTRSSAPVAKHSRTFEIRVRGRVQGVGFRPTVWRYARELGLAGEVLNDPEGVLIRVIGTGDRVRSLVERLRAEPPRLARVAAIEVQEGREPDSCAAERGVFRIAATRSGPARTEISPDAVVCGECAREIADPRERRYRYPFASCTQCGPRLGIVARLPFERGATTMAPFALCPACRLEYEDPRDRRFHAEAVACPECGPRARLVRTSAGAPHPGLLPARDELDAVRLLLEQAHIVALKGLGGFQLACDATNEAAVRRLRERKRREAKPFALMARDLEVIRRYCALEDEEARQLTSAEGPIVLLRALGRERLPEAVAPGLRTLGFMLPSTPLHQIVLADIDRPIVMTSGNLSEEPQVTDDAEALEHLGAIADYILLHDRRIANRVDDSVVRVFAGRTRVIRRARGYAPAPVRLPEGFEAAPDILAFGGELKSTFCLLSRGRAILSQHQGDLESAAVLRDFERNISLYAQIFAHAPRALAADRHPEYLASKLARERARSDVLPLVEVQHHHAHLAACLAENGRPLDAPPALGIVLDGLGWGEDETIWGGELLVADYRRAQRVGSLKPVAMPGGAQAIREPWRNLYAHLTAACAWSSLSAEYAGLELWRFLESKPLALLDALIRKEISAPRASSCGRLFDAVAAALGICRERQAYEGEAACRLESLIERGPLCEAPVASAYAFARTMLPDDEMLCIDPAPMWRELLADLIAREPPALIAARFHAGLARALVAATRELATGRAHAGRRFDTVALSGGCFQNAVLLEAVSHGLEEAGFDVLSHREIPANDGGLALGQAAVAAARLIA